MRPPCNSTMRFAIAIPSPVPHFFRVIDESAFAAMPGPVSRTATVQAMRVWLSWRVERDLAFTTGLSAPLFLRLSTRRLTLRILHLEPVRRSSRHIARALSLRHDAFETE